MRLLVVDHVGNPGGSSRVVRALLPAIRQVRRDVQVTYLGSPTAMAREGLGGELRGAGISADGLRSLQFQASNLLGFPGSAAVIRRLRSRMGRWSRILPTLISGDVGREVRRLSKSFDVVYFPWPYLLEPPSLDIPIVGTFHDFNFRYFFGGVTFHPEDQLLLDAQMKRWLDKAWPVVSTHFMDGELRRFFPRHRHEPTVIHLGPPSHAAAVDRLRAEEIVASLRVPSRFLLYPCNTASHKNVASAIAAIALLRERGHHLPLVLTGPGLGPHVSGRASSIGVVRGETPTDVIGLGYVTNEQIDALITCAAAVVSCSTYEAGNGPGLDAWACGTPVAMSNIPAFLEHISMQGVRAQVFNPREPTDIASKISWILENPEAAAEDAIVSKAAIGKQTWMQTASGYLQVFDRALAERGRPT